MHDLVGGIPSRAPCRPSTGSQARGYTFCTVSELAALRGTALLPGEVYTGFPPLDG